MLLRSASAREFKCYVTAAELKNWCLRHKDAIRDGAMVTEVFLSRCNRTYCALHAQFCGPQDPTVLSSDAVTSLTHG